MNKNEAGKLGYIASCKTNKEKLKERVDAYFIDPTICKLCNSILDYKHRHDKFCSKSCAAKFNNVGRERKKWAKEKVPKPARVLLPLHDCLICDKKCKRHRTFCSNECCLAHKHQIKLEQFNTGDVSSQTAKNILIKLHGHKCMDCGWDKINPVSNKCPVELEHIDGNSQNNLPENLKLLCPNCHSLTATYKALNAGNGRHSRRERYQTGKSF